MANLIKVLLLTGLLVLTAGALNGNDSAGIPSSTMNLDPVIPDTTCFDCGQGISRVDAVAAANAACHWWFMDGISEGGDGMGYM